VCPALVDYREIKNSILDKDAEEVHSINCSYCNSGTWNRGWTLALALCVEKRSSSQTDRELQDTNTAGSRRHNLASSSSCTGCGS
jgi:hypothetical protein